SRRTAVQAAGRRETVAAVASNGVTESLRSQRSGYRLGLARWLFAAIGAMRDRLADVPHRTGAAHVGQDVEVVRVGGREREPLKRIAAPGVVAGLDPDRPAEDGVAEGQEEPHREPQRGA